MSCSFLVPEATISSCAFLSSPLLNAGHILSPRVKTSLPVSRCTRLPSLVIRCNGGRDDSFYMRRCVELARKAVGCTSPNPMVGCVIVKDGEIVGEGFHPRAGQPHAEVFALKDAGALAENATAYVSLEPCNHYGRTPPCTEALIHARVKKVVVGMIDPNPIVASKGVDRLRESGIDVTVGVEDKLCQKLNEAFIHRMVTGKPFVAMTYSISVNGRKLGRGVEEAGGYYSQLLQEYDGVILSSDILDQISSFPLSHETVLNQPQYIITVKDESSVLHLPNLIKGSAAKMVILAEKAIKLEPEMKGIEMVVLEKLNLSSVIDFCASQGLCSILLDLRGGNDGLGELMVDELGEKLVQKVVIEVCPIWSKENSVLSFGQNIQKLKKLESRILNDSVIIEGYM